MAGPIDLKADLNEFRKVVRQIADNTPHNAKVVLRNECRLMLEDLIDLTKPNKGPLGKRIEKSARTVFPKNPKSSNRPDKRIYDKWRFSRGGRVEKRKVNPAALKAFIAEERKHIGLFAASWLGSRNPLGARKIPAYIKQHLGKAEGSTKIRETPFSLTIFVSNFNHLLAPLPRLQKKMLGLLKRAIQVRTGKAKTILKNLQKYGGKYKMPKAK